MNSKLKLWITHPISQALLNKLKDERDNQIEILKNDTSDSLRKLGKIQGQIFMLDAILDIETFLEEVGEDDSKLETH